MESSYSQNARIEPLDSGAQSDASVNSYRILLPVEEQFKLSIERAAAYDKKPRDRKERDRIKAAKYYEEHKDTCKERMKIRARHKRLQLDDSLKATREAVQRIPLAASTTLATLATLTESLNALENKPRG